MNASEGMGFDVIITAGVDGVHMKGSKHYTYEALDLRTSNIPPPLVPVYLDKLKTRLGPDYDVVLESDHIHAEFDPKPHSVV